MNNQRTGEPIQAGLLLIVGNSALSESVGQRIISRGYNIEQAASSRDAVARVSNGEVTVILLDLSNGPGVAWTLRTRCKACRFARQS